jgi:hypothetical protein
MPTFKIVSPETTAVRCTDKDGDKVTCRKSDSATSWTCSSSSKWGTGYMELGQANWKHARLYSEEEEKKLWNVKTKDDLCNLLGNKIDKEPWRGSKEPFNFVGKIRVK